MSSIKGNRFHPFQKKKQATQTQSSSVIISGQSSDASDLRSSPLLDYLGYRFNTKHSVMICVACECAILPDNALGHVRKKHTMFVSKEQQAIWDHTVTELNVTNDAIISPPVDHKAVELLKLHPKAFCCNSCDYACLSVTTFAKHWSADHRSINLPSNERYHEGWVQTFYSHAPCKYFEVDVPIPNSTPLFNIYVKKEIPNYLPFDVVIPSAPREIPPLLYNTRWHEHLTEYLTEKPKRRLLFSLAHPTNYSKDPLWKLVLDYLKCVVNTVKDSSMRVRCLLTEFPR
jgi:hypothetical protein